jgi:hypothetical protein
MRLTHHLAVLGLLGVMTLTGLGARWGDPAASVAMAAPSPTPIIFGVTQSSVVTAAPGVVSSMTQSGGTGAAPVVAAPSPTAAVAAAPAPDVKHSWVQNFRPTEIFDGPDAQARSLGTIPQFTTFDLLEQIENGRSRLFDPGQGEGRLPAVVWANMGDFGPSGPPKYQYELAKGGDVVATTGRRAPERIAAGWPPLPSAESAIIIDGDSGAVLYAKSAHTRLAQASTTKMMTAIVALENGRLEDKVTVDVDSQQLYLTTESTVMGLMPGQTVTLETLLYGLMLSSGNDAAIAIAKHVAGSETRFVEMMNAKARELGLRDTQFKNPHGLDATGHFSSAYDLAMLARYGFQNPRFYALSNTRHWNADGFDLWNLNKLLGAYPGADGVKPGFTDDAGRCLVGSAVRDNHRVFVTVLRSSDTTQDSRWLLDYAFDSFRWPS